MKKMKKFLSVIMVMLMSLCILSGCASKNEDTTPDKVDTPKVDTIKIAVAAPMTGDYAEYGEGFYNAAKMKADEWNAKEGVLGRKIEIVKYDDKNSSEEASSIAQKIVSDKKIVGVIGHFASGVCLTAAPIYQENSIIEISPSASHADYTAVGDFIFRNNTVIRAEAAASIDIAVNDMGKKKIGIISIKTDWGTVTADVLKELVKELGDDSVTIVAHEEVVEGSDDYSPAITKLTQAGADVVICAGMYSLVAPVAKQYKRVNPDIEIVGFSNAYSQQLIELGGKDVEGVTFPVIFFSGSQEPVTKQYVDAYEAKYGTKPSALTSQAYDSVGMLLSAIEEAGVTDSQAVRDALAEIEYDGVAGNTKFDEKGDVQKNFVKVTIKDGEFVQLD
jgi:branched-chain amino acid transport system substrate-binding protein